MTDKDPKDMTASELVRWAVSSTGVRCDACEKMGLGCSEENGEPVQQDDLFQVGCGLTAYANFALVALDGSCYWLFDDWDGELTDDRVKRPAPEALGADGLPVVEGETVWLDEAHSRCAGSCGFEDDNKYSLCGIERQEMLTVEDAHIEVDGREYVRVCTCGAWCHASWLTHTPPETQERIDRDAALPAREYYARHIGHDVAEKGAVEVHAAVTAHLLKRQRELDAKGAI